MNNRIYAVRDKKTGKLVSDITNLRKKYWERKTAALEAIIRNDLYRRRPKYGRGDLELVTFVLVEVKEE